MVELPKPYDAAFEIMRATGSFKGLNRVEVMRAMSETAIVIKTMRDQPMPTRRAFVDVTVRGLREQQGGAATAARKAEYLETSLNRALGIPSTIPVTIVDAL